MVEKEPGIAFQAEGTAICKSFDSRRKALSLVQEPNGYRGRRNGRNGSLYSVLGEGKSATR